jgi:GMP synthase (glutamine-hydrolysing)
LSSHEDGVRRQVNAVVGGPADVAGAGAADVTGADVLATEVDVLATEVDDVEAAVAAGETVVPPLLAHAAAITTSGAMARVATEWVRNMALSQAKLQVSGQALRGSHGCDPQRVRWPTIHGMVREHTVLVVDFGAQYAQLIARRVRELNVYSEIVPHRITAAEVAAKAPSAIILSGGPKSVHVEGAPALDPAIYDLGVPILGICYGVQLIAQQLGGTVGRGMRGEYGRAKLTRSGASVLLDGTPNDQDVWMSHFDAVTEVPAGFTATASTPDAPVAAMECTERRIYGVQWHPEVVHSPHGMAVLQRFLHDLAGCTPNWTMGSIIDEQVAVVKAQVGNGRVICALSGGVDSAVAAALVHKAIGHQLVCIYVDTGLMRLNESDQVVETFKRNMGIELIHVSAGPRYFEKLAGVVEPELKRKIIGELFVRIFEEHTGGLSDAKYLVQGTLYPDVIESGGADGTAAVIKSHHNVGGLPEDMTLELVEPLRDLFKDEVRKLGKELGLPDEIVLRQPFPGPGLGVRILGEVTPERVVTLQKADAIVRDEIHKAGLERQLWQSFAVLAADVRSVGVMGDERTYAHPIIIRAVTSDDAMTADWARLPYDLLETMSNRIINEVPGVNRVVYDVTSKPPGTIEWE